MAAFVANSLITILIAHASFVSGVVRGYKDNPVDAWLIAKLQHTRLFRGTEERTKFWNPIIEDLVLVLSDQQLLIGIAILAAGFLQHCSISAYHFTIVSDLAWFSSNTHLTALSVLRVRLIERPSLRNWRTCLMIPMAILLVASLILQGHRYWYDSLNSPAQCLFSNLQGNFSGEPSRWSMGLTFLVLYGYIDAINRLYDWDYLDNIFFEYPMKQLQKAQRAISIVRLVWFSMKGGKAFMAIAVLLPVQCMLLVVEKFSLGARILLGSITANLIFDIAWFAWGIWSLHTDRTMPQIWINGNEDAWGFGQIVPVLLTSSIILTFKELLTGEYTNP